MKDDQKIKTAKNLETLWSVMSLLLWKREEETRFASGHGFTACGNTGLSLATCVRA